MQTNEFNKLMEGKEAKWLDDLKQDRGSQLLSEHSLYLGPESEKAFKSKLKEIVKTEATPIPEDIAQAINRFVGT